MLRWKSSLKPAAAGSGLSTPTLLGIRNPTSTSSSSTSINISSATQGALLLASVTARSTQGNLSAPTEGGWTLLASVDNGSSSASPLNRVYYKTAGASESTVTWTHDSDYTSAVAIEIVGADTSTLAVTTNQSSDDLGVVTVPANGFVIAVHAKGASGDTSASTVRSSDGSTQTQYTALGDAYGTKRSGTFMGWGNVGAGDTNGTDYIEGAGSGSGSATHHIAIKPSGGGGSGITLENQASNSGHSGYSSPRNMSASYPAVSANDIMLMIVVTATTTNLTSSPPTGWTKVLEIDSYSTIGIYWKLATSSASASTGNTWSDVFSSNEDYYVWVGAYSGCDTTAPVDASNSQAHTGYNTAWSISITTQTNNAMIVTAFGRNKDDKTATFSDGTQVVSTYFRNEGYININEKIEATAGSHTRSATFSGNARGAKAAIALKPA